MATEIAHNNEEVANHPGLTASANTACCRRSTRIKSFMAFPKRVTMSGLEARIVVAAVGAALAAIGMLAAANFKDLASRQARWNAIRYRPDAWAEWGPGSFYYKSQFWCFRAFGSFIVFTGIVLFVIACA
jgi:hypothetical protein